MTSSASLWQIWLTFTRLGITSFGGPSAHVAYFHHEFVTQKKWVSDHEFAQDNALCQIVPGPASSQLGMLIGARRGGVLGSVVAWLGFTTPSALVMLAVLWGSNWLANSPVVIHGLLLAAACAVTHAIWSMARAFCQTTTQQLIAVGCTVVPLLWALPWIQLACIVVAGALATRLAHTTPPAVPAVTVVSRRTSMVLLGLFLGLCAVSVTINSPLSMLFQTGALVFGGGHVMLPLLHARLVGAGYLSSTALLQGYASVQLVPGPLFSIGAYVGALTMGGSVWAAATGLVAIFLPGWLLIMGIIPWWHAIQTQEWVRRALTGVQAAVVGLLAATLIDPIVPAAISTHIDTGLWLLGATLLIVLRWPAWLVTVLVLGARVLLASVG